MAITRTPIIDDDGSGTTGTVIDNAWKTEFYNQIDGALGIQAGVWTNVPFNAGDYTASGGTTPQWIVSAGNVTTFCWTHLLGTTIFFAFRFESFTISGSPAFLDVAYPAALATPVRTIGVPFHYYLSGGGTGVMQLGPDRKIHLLRDIGGTAWPNITNGGYLTGEFYVPY